MLGLFAAIRSPMEVEATAAAVDAICLVLFPPLMLDRVLDTSPTKNLLCRSTLIEPWLWISTFCIFVCLHFDSYDVSMI